MFSCDICERFKKNYLKNICKQLLLDFILANTKDVSKYANVLEVRIFDTTALHLQLC